MGVAMSRIPLSARLLMAGMLGFAMLLGPVPASSAAEAPMGQAAASIPNDPTIFAKAQSIPHSQTVPGFPRTVTGYRLRSDGRTETRLFRGNGWEALTPLHQAVQSCGDFRWYVRWRSTASDVPIDAAVGDTALPGFNPVIKPSRGSAGYITGFSCVSPGLRYAMISGVEGGLVDVDYEYQIWERYRPI